jgi:hypothetical protein
MSFREKNAWIAVVTTLIVWGYYFFAVWQAVGSRDLDGQRILNLFYVCMGLTAVLLIGINLIAARVARQNFGADLDEREVTIERRSRRAGVWLLEWMVLGIALAALLWNGWVADAFPAEPLGSGALIIANALLFALVVSNMLTEIVAIVHFRMMA